MFQIECKGMPHMKPISIPHSNIKFSFETFLTDSGSVQSYSQTETHRKLQPVEKSGENTALN